MALTDAPARLLPLAEEALENRYARENLREGAEKLREGAAALASGRTKPQRTGRKVVLMALGLGAAGAAAALTLNQDLRDSVFGSARALGEEVAAGPAPESTGSEGSAS